MSSGLSINFNIHMVTFSRRPGFVRLGKPCRSSRIIRTPRSGANYSNSNFDVRHAFKGYVVYQLPFGRGKRFLNNSSVLDEVVGGWQISGTVILQTGQPFSVYGDQANYSLAGTTFPNRNPGVSLYASNKGINGWFNPAAFTKPADGTWGNLRRNSLYGPGLATFSICPPAKSSRLPWEQMRIEFRADAKNVFNHKSLGIPGGRNLGGRRELTNLTPAPTASTPLRLVRATFS